LNLNEDRLKIVNSRNNLLVMGGPGSGKTTIALLKANNDCKKLKPNQYILFLSFARATVSRVMEHCVDYIDKNNRDKIKINTYHAFEWEIIKNNAKLLTSFPISIILPHDAAALLSNVSDKEITSTMNSHFASTGQLHFDLFASKTVELLSKCDCILRILCDVYPIIIFDEFQDTDKNEWELVKLLGKYSTIIALADPEQRIYDFRGASPERISEYTVRFKPDTFDFGTENNRSNGTDIVQFGNDLLTRANKGKKYNDVLIYLYKYRKNSFHLIIKEIILNYYYKMKKQNPELTLAVLTPTNQLMLDVSECLYSEQKLVSGGRMPSIDHEVFVDSAGPSLAAEFIAFLLDCGSRKAVSINDFVKMLNRYILGHKPKNKISQKDFGVVKALSNYLDSNKISGKTRISLLSECINIVNAANEYEYCGSIYDDWKYVVNLFGRNSNEYFSSIFHDSKYIKLLKKGSVFYSTLDETWRANSNYTGAGNIITDALTQEHFSMSNQVTKGISVMTIHKSKGKEFDIVIVYEGLYSGKILSPHADINRAIINLRVAVTRARNKTIILTPEVNPCTLL